MTGKVPNERKLVMYISMSLDGFIATKDDDISWLSIVETAGEDYGYHAFTASCDTYIVGKGTYEKVKSLTGGDFPQKDLFSSCYIITRQDIPSDGNVIFYNGDLKKLIEGLKNQLGKNIYFDGGSIVAQLLMKENLIDEYIISIIPILLGDGKRLFKGAVPTIKLLHEESKQYDSGLVQARYTVLR